MSWNYLILAALFEIIFAVGLKYTNGFTQLIPSILTVTTGIISLVLLSQAIKSLPVGTAYAVWTGIGTIGAVIGGIVIFDESRGLIRLVFISLIIISIVGLKFTQGS